MAFLTQRSVPTALLLLLASALLHSASSRSFIELSHGQQVADDPQLSGITTRLLRSTKVASKPNGSWCIARIGVPDDKLQTALDWACKHSIDCEPLQPGSVCFEPNTVADHASHAMNLYYQKSSKQPSDCDFNGSAMLTSKDPSHGKCVYPPVPTETDGEKEMGA